MIKRDHFDPDAAAALADAIGVASGECCGHVTLDNLHGDPRDGFHEINSDSTDRVPSEYLVLEQLENLGWKLVHG